MRRTQKRVSADPQAKTDDIDWLRKRDPIAALQHPNCPAELWWQLAVKYPWAAEESVLFPLFTLESPERWAQMNHLSLWIHAAVNYLPERDQHLFAADCAERALPIFERQYPNDKRPREAIRIRRSFAIGKAPLAQWVKASHAANAARKEVSKTWGAQDAAYAAASDEVEILDKEFVAYGANESVNAAGRAAAQVAYLAAAEHSIAKTGRGAHGTLASMAAGEVAREASCENTQKWQWARVKQYLRGEVKDTVGAEDWAIDPHGDSKAMAIASDPETSPMHLWEALRLWEDNVAVVRAIANNPNANWDTLTDYYILKYAPNEMLANPAIDLLQLENPSLFSQWVIEILTDIGKRNRRTNNRVAVSKRGPTTSSLRVICANPALSRAFLGAPVLRLEYKEGVTQCRGEVLHHYPLLPVIVYANGFVQQGDKSRFMGQGPNDYPILYENVAAFMKSERKHCPTNGMDFERDWIDTAAVVTGDPMPFRRQSVGARTFSLGTMSDAAFAKLSESEKDRLSYEEDAWLRPRMIGKEVEVHLNLGAKSKSPRSIQTWSVRDAKTHKVMGHVFAAQLRDVSFLAQPSAVMRAVVAQDKTPHAFFKGTLVKAELTAPARIQHVAEKTNVRYSPNFDGHLFFYRQSENGKWNIPVRSAKVAVMIGGRGTGWHQTADGIEDMSADEINRSLLARQAAYREHQEEWEEIRKEKDLRAFQEARKAGKSFLIDEEMERQVEALSTARIAKYYDMASRGHETVGGYDTTFIGGFSVEPSLKKVHRDYLTAFSQVRHMQRDVSRLARKKDPRRVAAKLPLGEDGAYFIGSKAAQSDADVSVLQRNRSPAGQPGLWCQWIPSKSGALMEWDGGEKFYAPGAWLQYLLEHFLIPWGYTLHGEVFFQGEIFADHGKIVIDGNRVWSGVSDADIARQKRSSKVRAYLRAGR